MSCCLKRVVSETPLNQEPVLITNRHSLDVNVVSSLSKKMRSNVTPEALFDEVISNNAENNTLKTWCVNHYCEEAYDFIVDYKTWKKQSTAEGVEKIFNKYIKIDANSPIDTPPQCRENLIVALNANNLKSTEIELQKCFEKVAQDLRGNFC